MPQIELGRGGVHKIILVFRPVFAAYEVGVYALVLNVYADAHGIAGAVQAVKG